MTKYIAIYRQHPKQSSVHPIRMGQQLLLDDVGMALTSMDANGWIRPVIIDSSGAVHRHIPWHLWPVTDDSPVRVGLFDTESAAWFAMVDHHGSSQEPKELWWETFRHLSCYSTIVVENRLYDSAMALCNLGPDYPLITGVADLSDNPED